MAKNERTNSLSLLSMFYFCKKKKTFIYLGKTTLKISF